jgi:LCP family protein required for cell wall assembly
MAPGRHSAPKGRSSTPRNAGSRSLANEQRLVALGQAIDQRNGLPARKGKAGKRRWGRISAVTAIVVVLVLVAGSVGAYYYGKHLWGHVATLKVNNEIPTISGEPFNVLSIGSDSRVGLTGAVANQTGGSAVSGQRSDVVKIMHIDPSKQTIDVISIPRDTLVTLLANQALYTRFNRINVNYGSGPDLLVRTIEANFGIPINHVIQVGFAGLINAAVALGGVYLDFPYPARDAYSGLNIHHAGCQLVDNFQALAVARSRHYEYYANGQWNYDGTSDYGRIQRQDSFLRAMISRARGTWNPATITSVLNKLPEGIAVDTGFTFNEMLGLAYKFKSFAPSQLHTYTLPTVSAGYVAPYGDVLVVDQPAAQKLLVSIFGSEMTRPTNPPPNAALQTPQPPSIAPTTTTTTSVTTTSVSGSGQHHTPATTTTLVPSNYASFNPVPCTP